MGIIEILIVITIMTVAFTALLLAATYYLRNGILVSHQSQALFLLDEGVEAMRYLRDDSFTSNISPLIGTGPFYIEPTTNTWVATSTNNLILGRFTRVVELVPVFRKNADDDIVPALSADPSHLDPDTTQLTVMVSWGTGSLETTTYITNLYDN